MSHGRAMGSAHQRELSPAERLAWLRLIRSENVGPTTFFKLLEHFSTAEAALAALPELARRGGRTKPVAICPKATAERELEALAKIGARLLAWGEPDYPEALAAIDDPPPLIAVRGHAHLLKQRMVAVVGARNASANGRRFARQLATDLGQSGLVVISGMARGIDASAHEGALGTGTVAVMASGIDVIYPSENTALYEEIVARGAALSENPPGSEPLGRYFPRRNRMISGLSLGIVVVEAAARSGSLITARLALEQGREVFAVPGSPLDPRCRGTNSLIRQGAVLTESAEDVLSVLEGVLRPPLAERRRIVFPAPPAALPSEDELDTARAEVVERLSPVPTPVDEILRQCQLSSAVLSTVLLELELAGRLERHPGNQVSLS